MGSHLLHGDYVIGEVMFWFWSKFTPKLRTGEFALNVYINAESGLREIDGSEFP